jgi:hypothetical protein
VTVIDPFQYELEKIADQIKKQVWCIQVFNAEGAGVLKIERKGKTWEYRVWQPNPEFGFGFQHDANGTMTWPEISALLRECPDKIQIFKEHTRATKFLIVEACFPTVRFYQKTRGEFPGWYWKDTEYDDDMGPFANQFEAMLDVYDTYYLPAATGLTEVLNEHESH